MEELATMAMVIVPVSGVIVEGLPLLALTNRRGRAWFLRLSQIAALVALVSTWTATIAWALAFAWAIRNA